MLDTVLPETVSSCAQAQETGIVSILICTPHQNKGSKRLSNLTTELAKPEKKASQSTLHKALLCLSWGTNLSTRNWLQSSSGCSFFWAHSLHGSLLTQAYSLGKYNLNRLCTATLRKERSQIQWGYLTGDMRADRGWRQTLWELERRMGLE